jgi:hypothetical protein
MLKVATGKLKLEHLVIERGHFKQEKEATKVVLQVSVTYSPGLLLCNFLCAATCDDDL